MSVMMEATPANLIGAMMQVQNGLNTKSYDTAWIEKGKTEEFDYAMAAGDEAHEFARSLPFQWWTKDKEDRQNQVTEIVDAWHFVMSQAIIDADGDLDAATAEVVKQFDIACNTTLCSTVQRQTKLFVAMMYMHNGPFHLSTPESYIKSFFNWTAKAEVSIQQLYARYIGKATLNKFRVENGYKQGKYKKIWKLGTTEAEDNYFLASYVDTVIEAGGEFSEENVREYLQKAYSSMDNSPVTT